MCVCMCERLDSYFHSGLIIKNKDSWVFSILIYIFQKIVNLTRRRRRKKINERIKNCQFYVCWLLILDIKIIFIIMQNKK